MKNEIRNRVFKDLYNSWEANGYKGYARISVGAGKTYMMIKIIKEHIEIIKNPNIIILVPTRVLRDKTFIDEIKKWWNLREFKKYCTLTTYQTQMNISDEHYTLGLFDEGDILFAPRFLDGFTNNIYDKYLCLSGTFTKAKIEKAREVMGDMIYDYPLSKAQEEGLVNKTEIVLIEVPLSTKKEIKKKVGYWSENDIYNWINNTIRKSIITINSILNEEIRLEEDRKILDDAFKQKKYFESGNWKYSRTNFLYSLPSTTKATKHILNYVINNTPHKSLIFSQRTAILDAILGNNTFYGNKSNEIIDAFNKGKIKALGVSKKVERGINFKNLNVGIFQSYSSSESEFVQRIGRFVRLDPKDTATIYIVYSTYIDNKTNEVKKCQNYKWVTTALDGIGIDWKDNPKSLRK